MRARLVMVAGMLACGRAHFDATEMTDGAVGDSGMVVDAAPIERVQVQAPGFAMAATASVTIAQTAGNLLVAAVYWDQAPNTVTLADSAGLTWTALTRLETPGGTGCGGTTGNATGARLYFAHATTTATNTITVSQTSGAQPLGVMAIEYSGAQAAVDAEVGQLAPAASNIMTTPSITTTTSSVIVAFFNDTVGSGMIAGDASYVVQARDVGFPNVLGDVIAPAGTYVFTATLPAAQIDACWAAIAVAFR